PSRNEGMGRALVEAMALGIPAVGAAVGGIPAVIVDGECGRLVPPEDPTALAQALVELGRDELLRRKLGERAIGRAEASSTAAAEGGPAKGACGRDRGVAPLRCFPRERCGARAAARGAPRALHALDR